MAGQYLMVLAEPEQEASPRPPWCSTCTERASEVALVVSSSDHGKWRARDRHLDLC